MIELIERVLDTYTFTEIIELNDLTEEDVLYHLVNLGLVKLPSPEPIDAPPIK